jgi:hypothetical protein
MGLNPRKHNGAIEKRDRDEMGYERPRLMVLSLKIRELGKKGASRKPKAK